MGGKESFRRFVTILRRRGQCKIDPKCRRDATLVAVSAGQVVSSAPEITLDPKVGLAHADLMEKVDGIGGFFFRARDPVALADWYARVLGVDPIPSDYDTMPWVQAAGPTAFAPFDAATDYFGDPTKQFMLNFRVRDLDKMVAQIEAAGTKVKVDPETYPNGRFARFVDPEGNPVELWQPD
jgi:glyoxylase I family protein